MTDLKNLNLIHPTEPLFTTKLTKTPTAEEARALGEFLLNQKDGVGIAANQVGMDCRLIVIKDPSSNFHYTAMLNPEIVRTFSDRIDPIHFSKKKDRVKLRNGEGCLSYPDTNTHVKRFECIDVVWTGLDGLKHEKRLRGYDAVVFQHEVDHLDGISCIDTPYKV